MPNYAHKKVRTNFKALPYWLVKYSYVPFGSKSGVAIIEERYVQERTADKAYEFLCDIIGRNPKDDGVTKLSVTLAVA